MRIPDERAYRIYGISMVILIRALSSVHVLTQESQVGNTKVYLQMPEAGLVNTEALFPTPRKVARYESRRTQPFTRTRIPEGRSGQP